MNPVIFPFNTEYPSFKTVFSHHINELFVSSAKPPLFIELDSHFFCLGYKICLCNWNHQTAWILFKLVVFVKLLLLSSNFHYVPAKYFKYRAWVLYPNITKCLFCHTCWQHYIAQNFLLSENSWIDMLSFSQSIHTNKQINQIFTSLGWDGNTEELFIPIFRS